MAKQAMTHAAEITAHRKPVERDTLLSPVCRVNSPVEPWPATGSFRSACRSFAALSRKATSVRFRRGASVTAGRTCVNAAHHTVPYNGLPFAGLWYLSVPRYGTAG